MSTPDSPARLAAAAPRPTRLDERLWITVLAGPADAGGMAGDVIRGLTAVPKQLSPKYFYDERGSQLFDAICDTPEYYLTRTEQELLDRCAGDIIADAQPADLVELGSGASRKTRALLDALVVAAPEPRYVPVDISEAMLIDSARALLPDYPALEVHGIVADYDHHLHLLPDGGRGRLIAFLGSTLGNFDQPSAVRFLSDLAASMTADDRLLLGLDLVKAPGVLHAAYNDEAGLTAEFNLNVLRVLNRELGADFDPDGFEHRARYLPEQAQIEMYLQSRRVQTVRLDRLDRSVSFAPGEEVRTEISRKFTREGVAVLARAAGLEECGWHCSPDEYFALLVARRAP